MNEIVIALNNLTKEIHDMNLILDCIDDELTNIAVNTDILVKINEEKNHE